MTASLTQKAKKRFTGIKSSKVNVNICKCNCQEECTTNDENRAKCECKEKEGNLMLAKSKKVSTLGGRGANGGRGVAAFNAIPAEILENKELKQDIQESLPLNYNFEIYKSVHQILKFKAKKVALQFPEGLLMFSLAIADILEKHCNVETLVMGDVTYGACCIDDFTARSLECDFMIHYGHSCLVPVDVTFIKTLYVFVDISINMSHFIETVRNNIAHGSKIALVATIQFVASLQSAVNELSKEYSITVPQSRPLSKGEILGCTAPKLSATNTNGVQNDDGSDLIIYLGDGRFHLEAIMIANPSLPAYRYDPYSKKFTKESYDHSEMHSLRKDAIEKAKSAKKIGLILGTLGRQGSPKVMQYLESQLQARNIPFVRILLSEIMPAKLAQFPDIDAWIQISCPRLSIDWGYSYPAPLLTPYEAAVLFNQVAIWSEDTVADGVYPMDFYAKDSRGPWTPNHAKSKK